MQRHSSTPDWADLEKLLLECDQGKSEGIDQIVEWSSNLKDNRGVAASSTSTASGIPAPSSIHDGIQGICSLMIAEEAVAAHQSKLAAVLLRITTSAALADLIPPEAVLDKIKEVCEAVLPRYTRWLKTSSRMCQNMGVSLEFPSDLALTTAHCCALLTHMEFVARHQRWIASSPALAKAMLQMASLKHPSSIQGSTSVFIAVAIRCRAGHLCAKLASYEQDAPDLPRPDELLHASNIALGATQGKTPEAEPLERFFVLDQVQVSAFGESFLGRVVLIERHEAIVRDEDDGLKRVPVASIEHPAALWFEVLGVRPTASEDQVKKAYKQKAKRVHPDKGGSVTAFQQVENAYHEFKQIMGMTETQEVPSYDDDERSMPVDEEFSRPFEGSPFKGSPAELSSGAPTPLAEPASPAAPGQPGASTPSSAGEGPSGLPEYSKQTTSSSADHRYAQHTPSASQTPVAGTPDSAPVASPAGSRGPSLGTTAARSTEMREVRRTFGSVPVDAGTPDSVPIASPASSRGPSFFPTAAQAPEMDGVPCTPGTVRSIDAVCNDEADTQKDSGVNVEDIVNDEEAMHAKELAETEEAIDMAEATTQASAARASKAAERAAAASSNASQGSRQDRASTTSASTFLPSLSDNSTPVRRLKRLRLTEASRQGESQLPIPAPPGVSLQMWAKEPHKGVKAYWYRQGYGPETWGHPWTRAALEVCKVAELKPRLRELHLPVSGSKPVLIDRLVAAIERKPASLVQASGAGRKRRAASSLQTGTSPAKTRKCPRTGRELPSNMMTTNEIFSHIQEFAWGKSHESK